MLRLRAKQVLEIALRVERNGVEFYDALVSDTSSDEARMIYEHAAGMEPRG